MSDKPEPDKPKPDDIEVYRASIEDFTPLSDNPNAGTERGAYMLGRSVEKFGAGRSLVADKNRVLNAGNHAQEAFADAGIEDAIVVKTKGDVVVIHQREDWDVTENDGDNPAMEYAFVDNRSSEVGFELDTAVLGAALNKGLDLGDWYKDWELGDIGIEGYGAGEIDKEAKLNPRQLPIDVIFTMENYTSQWTPMAYYSGLMWGIQSNSKTLSENYNPHYDISFVDNVYTDYQHDNHVSVVMRYSPKYATVMDVMTIEQCKRDNIKHYELSQILEWADELNQYAENVIVIPKYDCLDKIPEKFMLGYSVPTSHGGTPLPPEAFKGRLVHLLGGSWKAQLAHMAILGDDVVSLDNNHCHRIAEFGQFYTPDGGTGAVSDLLDRSYPNGMTIALAISFGAMGAKINELYQAVEEPAKGKKHEYQ